jgi:hypothetical protein
MHKRKETNTGITDRSELDIFGDNSELLKPTNETQVKGHNQEQEKKFMKLENDENMTSRPTDAALDQFDDFMDEEQIKKYLAHPQIVEIIENKP